MEWIWIRWRPGAPYTLIGEGEKVRVGDEIGIASCRGRVLTPVVAIP